MAQQQAPPAVQAPVVVVDDEVQITSDAMRSFSFLVLST